MGYTQRFGGTLRFPSMHALQAGLDAFVEVERSLVGLDALRFEEPLLVRVSHATSAPASLFEPTLVALSELASYASAGRVDTEFHLDGASRESVGAGRREGLPARHHRWDVFLAASRGDADALRALRSGGVDLAITFERYGGLTPLHLAARAGSVAAVDVLLAAGIPVDAAPSGSAAAPLGLAGNADVARRLLAAGADPNRLADGGRYANAALFLAAAHRRPDVAVVLIGAGAVLHDAQRPSILEHLCRGAALAPLTALVERSPEVARALAEPSVMEAAIQGGDPVVLDLLLSHGAALPRRSCSTPSTPTRRRWSRWRCARRTRWPGAATRRRARTRWCAPRAAPSP